MVGWVLVLAALGGGLTVAQAQRRPAVPDPLPTLSRRPPPGVTTWRWEPDLALIIRTETGRRQATSALARRPDGWWVCIGVVETGSRVTGYTGPYPSRAQAHQIAEALLMDLVAWCSLHLGR
jgi:hypothetical protein